MNEWDDMDPPSAEELAEAEALARALDRGVSGGGHDDLLGTAALLRYDQDQGALPEPRSEALLAEVLSTVRRPKKRSGLQRWFPAFATAAAAVALVVAGSLAVDSARPPLPAPSVALLRAQAAAATGNAEALDGAMEGYRSEVLAALAERHR